MSPTEPADEPTRAHADLLDLAAFLRHRAYDSGVTDAECLETMALAMGYREGDAPDTVESAMRAMALRFSDRPDYRDAWRPRSAS
jgi:hypothetical protein